MAESDLPFEKVRCLSEGNIMVFKEVLSRCYSASFIKLKTRDIFSESGSTPIEYALFLGLLSMVILSSVQALGRGSYSVFQRISREFEEAGERPPQNVIPR